MLIPVVYKNEKLGMVSPSRLDDLIASDKIIAFRRSSGWAILGEDPIRSNNTNIDYKGPERRKQTNNISRTADILEQMNTSE